MKEEEKENLSQFSPNIQLPGGDSFYGDVECKKSNNYSGESGSLMERLEAKSYHLGRTVTSVKNPTLCGSLDSLKISNLVEHIENKYILSQDDIDVLIEKLSDKHEKSDKLTYEQYFLLGMELNELNSILHTYLTPKLFLKLNKIFCYEHDCASFIISINHLFSFFYNMKVLQDIHLCLLSFCANPQAKLDDDSLYKFLSLELLSFINIDEKTDEFRIYLFVCFKKFSFFLRKNNAFKIDVLMKSDVMKDFLVARAKYIDKDEEDLESNWFSFENSQKLLSLYQSMSDEQTGKVNFDAISELDNGLFSQAFMQGLRSFKGDIYDLDSFVDFILVLENKDNPRSVKYLFRCFDIDQLNQISITRLSTIVASLLDTLRDSSLELSHDIKVSDIVNEVFDKINPQNKTYFTVLDLYRCKCGGTLLCQLANANDFYNHETRQV